MVDGEKSPNAWLKRTESTSRNLVPVNVTVLSRTDTMRPDPHGGPASRNPVDLFIHQSAARTQSRAQPQRRVPPGAGRAGHASGDVLATRSPPSVLFRGFYVCSIVLVCSAASVTTWGWTDGSGDGTPDS